MNKLIKVGHTQKVHGIKGELKLIIEDHFVDDAFEAEALFLEIKGQKVPYFVEEMQEGNSLILKLEGVDTRNDAEQLMHKDVYMRREDIRVSDEVIDAGGMYYKYMEGFTIFDTEEGEIAIISEVAEFPQQEMAYITYKKKLLLIPLNEELIVEVNREAKTVLMNLPEGLLGL
jgi:16S rRNA processing protein RimM